MINPLEKQIEDYKAWREQIASAISEYRDWLDLTGASDGLQDLRLYDMAESVRRDRLVLAFVAEFARGKTETINALFFSNYKTRLLPCDAGRTTMCPTEIFWDPNEEPYVKLLPIETRKNDDSITMLKRIPGAWTKLRLDTSSPEEMQKAFHALVQKKEVTLDEARALGLWNDQDMMMVQSIQTKGKVEIPLWRHALINFPHPLLKSGLVILDTPGLNTLGTEPELTINIIPSAHAVVFLLATDTGVTKSDMAIWTNYIRDRASKKIAVLNKIDILWDDLKTPQEVQAMIQSQVEATARQLNIPAQDVFAISAQKALLARIRNDDALLAKSGIEKVEHALAQNVVASKHAILRDTILVETSNMVKASRKTIQQRVAASRAQLAELNALRGKNREVVQKLLDKVSADRRVYEESVRTYTLSNQKVMQLGELLMQQLSLDRLDQMLDRSREEIGDSWTTHGLNQGMRKLIAQTTTLAEEITHQGMEIKSLADELYQLFHTKHGFEARTPPKLDMTPFLHSMQALVKTTDEFCSDPINVMTEKHFLVRKFFFSLVAQARAAFEAAHHDTHVWLKGLLAPLKLQIAEHKSQLDKRTESLMKIHENLDALQKSIEEAAAHHALLQSQSAALDQILLKLMKAAQTAAAAEPSKPATNETMGAPTLGTVSLTV
ncbi:MAG: dynamin family protein [Methylophilaceae bacterium]|nr:dynamin family protein [Methylophilaceae bacterium]